MKRPATSGANRMSNQTTTATQFANHYASLIGHVWFFLGGSLMTLLVSIFDETRRTAVRLLAGCIFGGFGAVIGGMLLESWGTGWMLFGAGVCAVMAENIVLGFVKASKEFSENPFKTVGQLIKDVLPSFPGFKKGE